MNILNLKVYWGCLEDNFFFQMDQPKINLRVKTKNGGENLYKIGFDPRSKELNMSLDEKQDLEVAVDVNESTTAKVCKYKKRNSNIVEYEVKNPSDEVFVEYIEDD